MAGQAPRRGRVGELNQRDPALREAAIRRLLPHPKLAAAPVVGAFTKGSLQPRLAALELLREWRAPVKELDPWQPGTLTAPRLEALARWAADPPAAPPAARELTADEQKAVRADFARLVAAPDAEAAAIRDRLARHGPALLAEVYAGLKGATTDAARERLTALRYRVAASDALALRWPGGLERLASTAAATRHEAVQELARRATAADEPLLLELFGSPDPLVREIGLRTLHAVAGRTATGALARLLQDPDPNVRAAVLKQLSDAPSPQVVTAVAAYLAAETDPDLVVHAVRVLRAAGQGDGGRSSIEHLLPQFRHPSWRVRAEAVEAVGECLSNSRFPNGAKESARAAVRGALADADGFVVGRAVGVLKKSGQQSDVEPLVKAAADHPELAAEVVAALGYGGDRGKASLPHLRAFCSHRDPAVRAKAVPAVCMAAPDEAAGVLKAGLTDPAAQVRQATAAQVFETLDSRRRDLVQNGGRNGGPPRPQDGTSGPDVLTADLRGGKGRPEGFGEMVPLLEAVAKTGEAAERAEAALALVALDQVTNAAPVLAAAAAADGHVVGRAARALPWLPWEQRFDLFRRLRALRLDEPTEEALVRDFAEVPDTRAVAPLWEMAARDAVPGSVAGEIAGSLVAVAAGNRYRISTDRAPPALLKLGEEARQKSRGGPEAQRVVALVVLVSVDAAAAAEAAKAVFDDATAPPALRRDAFQILLLCGRQGATATAVTGLASDAPDLRRLSVLYLSVGESAVHHLRERHVYLNANVIDFSDYRGGHARYVPRVPPGLDRAVLRTLLRDADPPTAAGAGYLLALLGDPDGLPPLLRHWRETARDDRVWTSLLVTAVSCLDDDALVPVIEEAYRVLAPAGGDRRDPGGIRDWNTIRDVYWIMRPMGGPNALRLRKVIRAEIGMRALGAPDRGGSFP